MKSDRFLLYAWSLLVYNLAVVYWGVYVRASFSGDGCGAHWPLCGGTVLPVNAQTKTLVEFSHRVSSGLAILLVVVLAIWAFRCFPRGHGARTGATLAVLFTFSEALIGAALVLFKLVAHNPSLYRAAVVSAHLVNTLALLAAITLTGWCAGNRKLPHFKLRGFVGVSLLIAALAVTALAITGTFAALGDSLFPSESIISGIKQDFAPTANYLIRLRPLHPLVAVLVCVYIGAIAPIIARKRPTSEVKLYKRSLMCIFGIQLLFGFVNLMKHAPVWMQLEHLLIADVLWINLMLFTFAALAEDPKGSAAEYAPLFKP